MADSAPRLYLAGGVTTARTAGSVETYTDLELKRAIDAGKVPGPKFDITGPYLEGPGSFAIQMHALSSPEDAAHTVDYWAAEGVTSFKAYNYLTAAELKAAIDHAHAHGIKITGHLCSIGFKQAAELGIDNLEHGIDVDTEFFPGKKPDECPNTGAVWNYMSKNVDPAGPEVKQMIDVLVSHHVAVTSTLAILETFDPNRPPMARENAALATLSTEAARSYLAIRARIADHSRASEMQYEAKFERAFAAAGGLLTAMPRPRRPAVWAATSAISSCWLRRALRQSKPSALHRSTAPFTWAKTRRLDLSRRASLRTWWCWAATRRRRSRTLRRLRRSLKTAWASILKS